MTGAAIGDWFGWAVAAAGGDVNGDSLPDIVLAGGWEYSSVVLLRGRGDGTFEREQEFNLRTFVKSVAIADLNKDEVPDILAMTPRTDYFSVFLSAK